MSQLHHIVKKLFTESSLENVPIQKFEQIVEEHPYFALGHLFKLKKLEGVEEDKELVIQKTAVYFNDPLWLQWVLQTDRSEQEQNDLGVIESHPPIEDKFFQPSSIGQDSDSEEEIKKPEELENQDSELPEQIDGVDEVDEVDQIILPGIESTKEPVPASQLEEARIIQQSPEVKEFETGPVKLSEDIKEEEKPVFEPYHTVDYFASQGIKISAEIPATDKLGQQLKSFTEWLKTMRKIPQAEIISEAEDSAGQQIRQIAEHSLEEKDIVTEAMAEVFVKQGRREEAIEIYHKLSLLNPSKRAYFAAKIEQLKAN